MLWQSEDTVVIGKHQNAMAEVNYSYVIENKIKVARRISGGGTVFHDAGNLNFAYIKNVDSPSQISFSRFVQPIVEALAKLGIQAEISGRNDLLIDKKKISGNAEHIFKNRVLHHGTLLFNSNLHTLGQAIKVIPGKYQGKAVQSKRSVVTNIQPFLNEKLTIEQFADFIMTCEADKHESSLYELNENDMQNIQQLATEKFVTWDWNYGYSPRYTFQNEGLIEGKLLKIELQVERGHITNASISGTFFTSRQSSQLINFMVGERHSYFELQSKLLEVKQDIQPTITGLFF